MAKYDVECIDRENGQPYRIRVDAADQHAAVSVASRVHMVNPSKVRPADDEASPEPSPSTLPTARPDQITEIIHHMYAISDRRTREMRGMGTRIFAAVLLSQIVAYIIFIVVFYVISNKRPLLDPGLHFDAATVLFLALLTIGLVAGVVILAVMMIKTFYKDVSRRLGSGGHK